MKVLFFASVREQLGCAELQLAYESETMTTETLRDALIARGGDRWRDVLMQPNLICAVNQAVAHQTTPLAADDEVAFFPPVTGG
ncbi:MAG: molybdopterin converting factor subunit 1 [Chromatocurvus sp.]